MRKTTWVHLLTIAILMCAAIAAIMGMQQWRKERNSRGAYLQDANGAITALRDLEALVKAGIVFNEYQRRLGDTRIIVDRFTRGHDKDLAEPSRKKILDAMDEYEAARNYWNDSIEEGPNSDLGQRTETRRSLSWELAGAATAVAAAALAPALQDDLAHAMRAEVGLKWFRYAVIDLPDIPVVFGEEDLQKLTELLNSTSHAAPLMPGLIYSATGNADYDEKAREDWGTKPSADQLALRLVFISGIALRRAAQRRDDPRPFAGKLARSVALLTATEEACRPQSRDLPR